VDLEYDPDVAQRQTIAVEPLGSLNALVVESGIATTSSGAVQVV
jgi:hypothetical protein